MRTITTKTILLSIVSMIINTTLHAQYFPDEEIDTSGYDIEIASDGLDTVFYFGEDEVIDSSALRLTYSGYHNANTSQTKIGLLDSTIYVRIGNSVKSVYKGLLGYHLGGAFDNQTIPNDSSSIDQWNWLSDLRPESVRIFSGSFSKFMHPLSGPGYGYDLEEIARFFDYTDDTINAPSFGEILDSINNDAYLSNWMSSDEVNQFQKYATKWQSQFDIDSTRRYIDDFLYLIKKIETENAGHRVKVIVCLDIMASSATECADMVKYLRHNDIWDCEVAYVELGNEMYFSFAESMMGLHNFDDYWTYINGGYPDDLSQYVVGDSVWYDHDYISAFKSDPAFQCKLAVPARNLGAGYAFFTPEYVGFVEGAESWNDTLATHYMDSIQVGTGAAYVKKFDGVVLHPYYDESNWEGIPDTTLLDDYPCVNLGDADTTNDEWTYHLYDDRLEWAFDSITYNFRWLIRQGYNESYLEHNNHLQFYLSVANGGKDLLTTEYNYKYEGNENKIGVYGQSFMHAYLLQEWILRNIKINYNADFRAGFFKYATVQNFAGATENCLVYPANAREREFLGKDIAPYEGVPDSIERNYHMKRTPYFVMELLSEISKQNLRYVQSNFTVFINSFNIQPTIFTDPDKDYLYMYFTNVRDTVQRYSINTAYTAGFYTGGYGIKITDTATIYCVDALKNYSTSGKGGNSLFDLNECYDETILFPIEITEVDTILNTPSCPGSGDPLKCIVVPAYSFGYIKIPIAPDIPLKESVLQEKIDFVVYPNPASGSVNILAPALQVGKSQILDCRVFNSMGAECLHINIQNGGAIDVSNLTSGVYSVLINFGLDESKAVQFVKQ